VTNNIIHIGDRVLVTNQLDPDENGVYELAEHIGEDGVAMCKLVKVDENETLNPC